MKTQNSNHAGISTLGLLGIVFVILKLIGVINWPWIWVTAPFWGGIAIVLTLSIILFLFAQGFKDKPKRKS